MIRQQTVSEKGEQLRETRKMELQELIEAKTRLMEQKLSEIQLNKDTEARKVRAWVIITKMLHHVSIMRMYVERNVRSVKQQDGLRFTAAVLIQSFVRRRMLKKRTSERTLQKIQNKRGSIASLRHFLKDHQFQSNLAERVSACGILVDFLRGTMHCFKGYIRAFIR